MNQVSPPLASPIVEVPIVVLPLVVMVLVVTLYARAHAQTRRGPSPTLVGLGLALWLAFTALFAASGLMGRFDLFPPPFVPFILAMLLLSVGFGLSNIGATLATQPLSVLVGLNAFRFPLELVMHKAALEGVMPPQMSYTGWNFDIVTGITALLLASALKRGVASRRLVTAWNVFGSLAILNIMTIALLSTPVAHAFGTDPHNLNTFVAYFPYVWLPGVVVATALAFHIVIARALRAGAGTPA